MDLLLPAALAVAFALSGCTSSGNYTRSVHGTAGGYSLANTHPTPANLMIARKNERPLYIVLADERVRNSYALETSACATESRGCERFELSDFQTFVRRDLKAAMANFFSGVHVIDTATPLPPTPHVVAHVKVDDVRLNDLQRGGLTYTLIQMTWGFALRRSEQEDYAYSFAGTSSSDDSYPTFEAGLETLVENAIPQMLERWVEEGGFAEMNAATAQAAP